MKRTSAEANDSGRYSEGNPSLGVPATVVGAEECNNIQEEIVNVVLDAGITLNGAIETQLLAAIKIIQQRGGTQLSQAIADNIAVDTAITDLIFAKATVKGARILYDIHRRDDGQSANEHGEMFVSHNTEADAWEITSISHFGDAEVTFSIDASGQVNYQSSNYGAANYAATARFTQITTLAQ